MRTSPLIRTLYTHGPSYVHGIKLPLKCTPTCSSDPLIRTLFKFCDINFSEKEVPITGHTSIFDITIRTVGPCAQRRRVASGDRDTFSNERAQSAEKSACIQAQLE